MAGQTRPGTIDLHADLPADVIKYRDPGEHSVTERRHLPKLKKGGVTGLVAPIWVESKFKPRGAMKRGLRIADAFFEDLSESTSFALAKDHSSLTKAESKGKVAVVLGCEGGEFIDGDLGVLRNYHRLGLRTFGFVWNERNALADGMYHRDDDRGLTKLGRQVVEELDDTRGYSSTSRRSLRRASGAWSTWPRGPSWSPTEPLPCTSPSGTRPTTS